MTVSGRLLWIAILVLAVSATSLPAQEKEAPKEWLADLEALQQGLARNYANFEYTLRERRIDLPAMSARYRSRLAEAATDADRRRVLEQLLEDFRDGHVRVEWPAASAAPAAIAAPGGTEAPPPSAPAACQADMANRATGVGVNWPRLDEFQPLASAHARSFAAGLLRRQGKPPLGVVRIGLFGERAFLPECQAAATELGIDPEKPCDDACVKRLEPRTVAKLGESLIATVEELRRLGARGLVVDVSNNGGGSDWSEVAARTLAGSDLRSARVAMLKHPVWEAYLDRRLAELEPELAKATGEERRRLERAAEVVRAARRAVGERCDLSAAWSDSDLAMGKKALPCSTLVQTDYFTIGLEPVFATAERPGAAGEVDRLLTGMGYYGVPPALPERLPLIVVVNRETHSSAEQFVALLRDNGRATIVGEPSAGTGCGTFTGTGTAFTLPHSGGRVHVPDCVRLRADGSNERRGIIPDQLIPWAPSDSAYQRARKTLEALEKLP